MDRIQKTIVHFIKAYEHGELSEEEIRRTLVDEFRDAWYEDDRLRLNESDRVLLYFGERVFEWDRVEILTECGFRFVYLFYVRRFKENEYIIADMICDEIEASWPKKMPVYEPGSGRVIIQGEGLVANQILTIGLKLGLTPMDMGEEWALRAPKKEKEKKKVVFHGDEDKVDPVTGMTRKEMMEELDRIENEDMDF